MEFDCQSVSVSEAGRKIFQILIEAGRGREGGPYLLLQRAFLEEDEGDDAPCYVETHDRRLIDHCPDIKVELTRHRLTVKLPPPISETTGASFKTTDEEFQRISDMLNVIVQ